jgi:hypothetical protein
MADEFDKVTEKEFEDFMEARWRRTGVQLRMQRDLMAAKDYCRDPTKEHTGVTRASPDVVAYIDIEYEDEFYIRRSERTGAEHG